MVIDSVAASILLPQKVNIVEVGARDGLQNEASVSLKTKVALINALSISGLRHIEAGAFVSPKRVPQMADSAEVLKQITRHKGVTYSALTPNVQGLEAAISAGASEVAVFASCSESFSQRNIHCSIAESINRFVPVINAANTAGLRVRGYLSCVADCPYDGATSPAQVAAIASELRNLGCYQISLGDTIGTGTPLRIARMLEHVSKGISFDQLAVHFHDTYGQALANIYQALTMGVNTIDSSVAGLGGCPYAAGASGNVATEEVLFLCEGLGIETGVDINAIARAGWQVCQQLNRTPVSKVSQALRNAYLENISK
ncbi:hydroxymethylglutaryl-CoA lyase [Vibrio hangzhouensis]|uniref:hydroxymethylglutaryl-CoA lyase n=1 Tax=Vibrio hangzhouensis TaxID=462991 RepID=A0A1H5RYZ0_9VIBR|nr:hydroxymethylglutaryl-CoA lyase [Vibrio hangzhouensis]